MQQAPYGAPPGGPGYGAPPGGGAQLYQVQVIDVGCCSGTIDHSQIATLSNQMAAQGYTLDKVFMDVRSAMGPLCPKRCAVLVFKRQ